MIFMVYQASGFLVSNRSHTVSEERELDENIYSNDGYGDTASLLEQVLLSMCLAPLILVLYFSCDMQLIIMVPLFSHFFSL